MNRFDFPRSLRAAFSEGPTARATVDAITLRNVLSHLAA
jgi:hypothetical protein